MSDIQDSMLDEVWPEGRNPDAQWDGGHYVLKSYLRPVSVSRAEAYFLTNMVYLSGATNIFEIGTGFGYSALWFGLGLLFGQRPGRIVTLDNYTEGGLGQEGLRAARTMAQRLGLETTIEFVRGSSPEDVPKALGGRKVEIAFIDANHHGPHPLDDYTAVKPFLIKSSALLLHDVDASRYSVPVAVAMANDDGWSIRDLGTSCYLTVAYKDDKWIPIIDRALRAAREKTVAYRNGQ